MEFEFGFENVKKCIAWAAGQGYCEAEKAAKEVERVTGTEMFLDQPYYANYAWRKVLPKENE